jgi:hypothetical protein
VFVGQRVEVRCFNAAGSPIDNRFALTFTSSRAAGNIGACLLSNNPTAPSYAPTVRYNSTGGTNTVARGGVGRYTAALSGLGARAGTVQVTATSSGSERCKAVAWAPSGTYQTVQVLCTTAAGTRVDATFALTYARNTDTVLAREATSRRINRPKSRTRPTPGTSGPRMGPLPRSPKTPR